MSHTWHSITKVWNKFREGLGKVIGDGSKTSACFDLWTPLPNPLFSYIKLDAAPINSYAKVEEWASRSEGWNVPLLQQWFNDDVIKAILAVKAPHPRAIARATAT